MSDFFDGRGEKKVEYIELIYDLIFVYLIGRNNALLHNIENGFFSVNTYITYLISTLVILQVWYFSTLFINRYGKGSAADYICLFVNMYLLYYPAGLFLGYLYDNIIDRDRENMESVYMLLHIVLIAALNNITVALEFMREAEVGEIAKNIFIVISFLLYYLFLTLIGHYSKEDCRANGRFIAMLSGISVLFVVLMAAYYRNSWLSIAVSAVYVYSMLGAIVLQRKQAKRLS